MSRETTNYLKAIKKQGKKALLIFTIRINPNVENIALYQVSGIGK